MIVQTQNTRCSSKIIVNYKHCWYQIWRLFITFPLLDWKQKNWKQKKHFITCTFQFNYQGSISYEKRDLNDRNDMKAFSLCLSRVFLLFCVFENLRPKNIFNKFIIHLARYHLKPFILILWCIQIILFHCNIAHLIFNDNLKI